MNNTFVKLSGDYYNVSQIISFRGTLNENEINDNGCNCVMETTANSTVFLFEDKEEVIEIIKKGNY